MLGVRHFDRFCRGGARFYTVRLTYFLPALHVPTPSPTPNLAPRRVDPDPRRWPLDSPRGMDALCRDLPTAVARGAGNYHQEWHGRARLARHLWVQPVP